MPTNRYIRAIVDNPGSGLHRAEWEANHTYAVGDRVVCRRAYATTARRCYVYECTVGGTSHATTEPTWPTSSTITDGGVTWTTRSPTSWANASIYFDYLLSVNVVNAWAPGDLFWIENTVVQDATGSIELGNRSYGNSGYKDTTSYVISTDDTTNEPPRTMAAGAKLRAAGDIVLQTNATYYYGIEFHAGYGASSGHPDFQAKNQGSADGGNIFDTCLIKLAYAVTACAVYCGGASNFTGSQFSQEFINTNFEFTHAGQFIYLGQGDTRVSGGAILGTSPDRLVALVATEQGVMATFTGMDLSLCTGTIISAANLNCGRVIFSRCKLNAGVTRILSDPTFSLGANGVVFELCDSGPANYTLFAHDRTGEIVSEATFVRSGGASDGVTPISWKFASTSVNQFGFRLSSPWITTWIDSVGAGLTVTVEAVHDNTLGLRTDELWLEALALVTSGWPLATFHRTNTLGCCSGAILAASADADRWYTSGFANRNAQKMSVVVTPMVKGLLQARVCFAKPLYTLYVDPKIYLS